MVATEDFYAPCCFSSIVIIFLFVLFVIVLFKVISKRSFENAFKSFAAETGCSYEKGGCFRSPRVSGTFRNRKIVVDVYTEYHQHHDHDGHGHTSSTTYTRLQVSHAGGISSEINIYPETFFSLIGKKLGMQDIQTGNQEFDKVFIVKGNDESTVRKLLDLDIQQKLLNLKMPVEVLSNVIYMKRVGRIKDKNLLMNMLNLMVDLAERAEKVR